MKSTVFHQKARDYALYRPQYACEAIDALVDIVGLDSTWTVADIASGTGNVSRHIGRRLDGIHRRNKVRVP